MPDYQSMYLRLMRAQLEALELLQQAHQDAEEMYLQSKDAVLLAPKGGELKDE